MNSATAFKTSTPPPTTTRRRTTLILSSFIKQPIFNTKNIHLTLKSLKCFVDIPNLSVSCSSTTTRTDSPIESEEERVANKLQRLVFEFRSLTEPIDRVKRLLHYAETLPPLNESARVEANRVTGCTTQVWVEAKMDEFGRMRFGADSDSQITKGFISCLVWMLDGAYPDEVLTVKTEDLTDMNVGIHGKEKSRVNTWRNVLAAMQDRTSNILSRWK
ncbi:SufE domain-containing protein [Cephalotus follicularis]|uniref:SufE domain-containing protein n=1 Tax=Cephalotus follicularis TaxID=3775 RepID=A0A1Q3D3D0_CEPFO|nr:SufE domain-containing protein [Cephalotus follicularis]